MRPFERGEAARSGSGGAGLGLPIVQRIARMHGGDLRLLANAPHGLRAELALPGALSEPANVRLRRSSSTTACAAMPSPRPA